ncbi:hypothetical protein CON65_22535 [Bacillus pseudomycoides]|uniref:Uncharacterized protein n=1 Tax=Bacillus pseudomycoides TaxID=64104 RepID=A0AA91ZRJ0_9BACI|nr:hypothetical protein COO03_05840 [Bacillus sp. AFS098217]PED80472.1 hypothetical protein CON65_22535 [Bacillus pseudomycoides]PEU11177.1 hypothetical protein CN525_22600 [Bacillus sp. AFS014408]PEU13082.1 hypothetical protein CN524_12090 [Bacillus sp. AFS019443]PFW61943.1 hypothetical protein COL20_15220 [Bacillus sp. AFS075034]
MNYIIEAILLILAVVLPLSCVLIFLKTLISNLGDSTLITKLPAETKKKKE